jgi:5-methyltetrahydropteroyltriglutamate--homocysteine methyltransferase
MPRTTPRAEHIGSLLRPQAIKDLSAEIGAHLAGHSERQVDVSAADRERLRELEDQIIGDVVARQVACGLDAVTDGELRRTLFTNSFYDAIDGLRPASPKNSRSWSNVRGEEITYPGAPVIERRLAKADSPAAREIAYVATLTDAPIKATFPAGSWFVAPVLSRADRDIPGYADEHELQAHAIEIERELIRDAIDAGATYIQLDFPSYVFLMDEGVGERLAGQGVDRDALLERCVWADTEVLKDLPRDGVRYGLHLCRGNFRSSWQFEGALDPIADAMFSLPYDSFLVEWDDAQRDGGFSALRQVPPGPVVVIGAVTTKSDELETEDDLVRRIEDASSQIAIEQLAISPQCGFASSMDGNLLSEDSQWRKLETIGRAADRIWGAA